MNNFSFTLLSAHGLVLKQKYSKQELADGVIAVKLGKLGKYLSTFQLKD
jgi:hypothetical protein